MLLPPVEVVLPRLYCNNPPHHAMAQFPLVVATLLSELSETGGSCISLTTASDTTFLQLHVVFGPMLVSAMQLVDRRDGGWCPFTLTQSSASLSAHAPSSKWAACFSLTAGEQLDGRPVHALPRCPVHRQCTQARGRPAEDVLPMRGLRLQCPRWGQDADCGEFYVYSNPSASISSLCSSRSGWGRCMTVPWVSSLLLAFSVLYRPCMGVLESHRRVPPNSHHRSTHHSRLEPSRLPPGIK